MRTVSASSRSCVIRGNPKTLLSTTLHDLVRHILLLGIWLSPNLRHRQNKTERFYAIQLPKQQSKPSGGVWDNKCVTEDGTKLWPRWQSVLGQGLTASICRHASTIGRCPNNPHAAIRAFVGHRMFFCMWYFIGRRSESSVTQARWV